MRTTILAIATLIAVSGAGTGAGPGNPDERDPLVLESWSIDGGGGSSVGGTFELLGSAGQHDATRAAAGDGYHLTGGVLAGGDPALVFVDGFEAAATDRWSATLGGGSR